MPVFDGNARESMKTDKTDHTSAGAVLYQLPDFKLKGRCEGMSLTEEKAKKHPGN